MLSQFRRRLKNEAEVIHENLSADEQTLSDVKTISCSLKQAVQKKISPKAAAC